MRKIPFVQYFTLFWRIRQEKSRAAQKCAARLWYIVAY